MRLKEELHNIQKMEKITQKNNLIGSFTSKTNTKAKARNNLRQNARIGVQNRIHILNDFSSQM